MLSCGYDVPNDYYAKISAKRKAYRKKLISKGIVDGSNKMRSLMCRKFK